MTELSDKLVDDLFDKIFTGITEEDAAISDGCNTGIRSQQNIILYLIRRR